MNATPLLNLTRGWVDRKLYVVATLVNGGAGSFGVMTWRTTDEAVARKRWVASG